MLTFPQEKPPNKYTEQEHNIQCLLCDPLCSALTERIRPVLNIERGAIHEHLGVCFTREVVLALSLLLQVCPWSAKTSRFAAESPSSRVTE